MEIDKGALSPDAAGELAAHPACRSAVMPAAPSVLRCTGAAAIKTTTDQAGRSRVHLEPSRTQWSG
jgi:hypothetical protein